MTGLRITGGKYKGRRIAMPHGRTRLTSARVREAVFDIVGEVAGWEVLDLFAGAGSFTCEALSRAARSVTSVEKEARTAAVLRQNVKTLEADKDCLVLNMDVRYALPMLFRQGKHFDLIFADPPYEMGYIAATLSLLQENRVYHEGSLLVFEHSKREEIGALPETVFEAKSRKYGDTVVSVVRAARQRGHES
jgi:16S rRNA (guanine(966)-N(2))-methyltransferase RsmD